jgi:glutamate-ammonia-ligase adenylyltransferase
MSYTKDGIAYKIDTRLRPEGSKGPLVSSIEGIRNYYLKNAQAWELQALLKARPISSGVMEYWNDGVGKYFMEMRKDVLMKRGNEIIIEDVKRMREKVQKELSKEEKGKGQGAKRYDIKLGSGGLEDLEFIIQYLQLKKCRDNPQIIVQGTIEAIKRLKAAGILRSGDSDMMSETYMFYRTIEILLRLRNESVLKEGTSTLQGIAGFMDMDEGKFLGLLNEKREWVRNFRDRIS